MNFTLYLELGSRAVDSSLLDILRFPAGALSRTGRLLSSRWWANGKTRRMRSADLEEILRKIAKEGFNALDLRWRDSKPSPVEEVELMSAHLECFPSPMNKLWAPVPLHQLKSPAEDRARRNFRNIESVLTKEYLLPYRSTLECSFELAVPHEGLSDAELQEYSIRWIRSAMPQSLLRQDIFGYGCVHGTCRRMSMVMSLGHPEIDDLGRKFENLYPILLGPRSSCLGLAKALEGLGTFVPFSEEAETAILSIPPGQLNTAANNPNAKQWIIQHQGHPQKQPVRVKVVPPEAPK